MFNKIPRKIAKNAKKAQAAKDSRTLFLLNVAGSFVRLLLSTNAYHRFSPRTESFPQRLLKPPD